MKEASTQAQRPAPLPAPDMQEYGARQNDQPQVSHRRLYMQLQVFTGCKDIGQVKTSLEQAQCECVLYLNVNDPQGFGVLFFAEDPTYFVTTVRTLLATAPFSTLTLLPEMTMFGRTYGTGRERELEEWLLEKPKKNVLDPEWAWAIWYPLRRKAEFGLLTGPEQGKILGEHAMIGRSYGEAGLARDVRLACHGLDKNDNEFVIGLIGKELAPLSKIVQDMRKTQQTAKYIQSLGPFFVGRATYQSAFK